MARTEGPNPEAATSEHGLGVALVLASTVPIGLSGIFVRLITAPPLVILCWRALIGGAIIFAYTEWQRRGAPRPSLGWRGWVLASVGSAASVAFLGAFRWTYVANVTVIYTFSPFAAALLEWLILRQQVRRDVLVTAMISSIGIGVMVEGGIGAPNFRGDLVAVASMGLSALYMVLLRVFARTPAVLAGVLSCAQIFALGWLTSQPLQVSGADMLMLVLFGLNFAAVFILWTEGARRLPAAEAGLFGSIETPLVMVFAWGFLGEWPPMTTLAGGALVLAAVAGRGWIDLRASSRSAG